jgi:hypothetical protein
MIICVAALFIFITGCGGPAPKANPPAQQSATNATKTWQADGIIDEAEYSQLQKVGEVDIFTRVEGEVVMIGLRAKTTGWIALGIDPEDKMKGADMLLCYVKDGKATVVDMYSTGTFGPHPPDDKQGGAQDVTVMGGSQKDGVTIVEFQRKLNTGDSKDKPLKKGENKILWGIGDSTDVTAKHSRRGYGILTL